MRSTLLVFFTFFTILCLGSNEPVYKFLKNKGQWPVQVKYRAQLGSGDLFLEKNCFTYSFYDYSELTAFHIPANAPKNKDINDIHIKKHAFKVNFIGSNENVILRDETPVSEYYNFYLGNDSSKWASNVKGYKQVIYNDIYTGIDLKLYTSEMKLKYDFIIQPGALPTSITMSYEGVSDIRLKNNNLVIKTSIGEIIEQKPYAYQLVDGRQKEVACKFELLENKVTFVIKDKYDKSFALIIDPILIFASYSGSTADNFGMTATYDNAGNFYAGGTAFDNGYPTTLGAYDITFNNTVLDGITDVVITKYDATGGNLIYSTYLGGSGAETVHSLIVNDNNELFLYGVTSSANFPTSSTAYDASFNGGSFLQFIQNGTRFNSGTDIYVSKFNANGTNLLGSTYIGGSGNDGVNYNNNSSLYDSLQYNYGDQFRGEIILDSSGDCYVATSTKSSNFPIVNGFQSSLNGNQDAIVFKLSSNLSTLVWSTYLGGSNKDAAYSLKTDIDNSVFVTGGTSSNNFPTTNGSLMTSYQGGTADGFLTKISSNGNSLLNSSFIGTTDYDQSYFVEIDNESNIYVLGQTLGSYLTTAGVYSNPNSPQFITKLNNTLSSVIFSTVFGNGSRSRVNISPSAFLVDNCQNIYVSGWGANILQFSPLSGMPITTNALFTTPPNGFDFYLMLLKRDATSLMYATYFGGAVSQEHVDGGTSRFDKNGIVYQSVCAGCGGSNDFPTTPGAWSATNNSFNCNNGTFKFDPQNILLTISNSTNPTCAGSCDGQATATASGTGSPFTYEWSNGKTTPTITGLCAGTYTVTVTDASTCIKTTFVTLKDPEGIELSDVTIQNLKCYNVCEGQISITASGGTPPYTYLWNNGKTTPSITAICSGTFTVTVKDKNNCIIDSAITVKQPQPLSSIISNTQQTCDNVCDGTVKITASGGKANYSYQWSNTPPSITDEVIGLCAGKYFVTITDSNGCNKIDTTTVFKSNFTTTLFYTDNIDCKNCNGLAVSKATGGILPYNYLWSNAETSDSISNLCSNVYYVTVTDSTGCKSLDSVLIKNPENFTLVLANSSDLLCNGVCIGEVNVTASGTANSISYQWSNGNTSQKIIDLCAGTYKLTATDDENCKQFLSVSINEPPELSFSLSSSSNINCNSICNGQATSTATGGTPPFTYNWSTGDTTNNATELCSNTYTLTITDKNNCTRDTVFTITEPLPLVASFNKTDQTCFTDCDGTIKIDVTGGTPFYNYIWNTGASSDSETALCPGNYSISITDANNCVELITITIDSALFYPGNIFLTADTNEIFKDESTVLHAIFDTTAKFNWSPITSLNEAKSAHPIASPQETTTYTFSIFDINDPTCKYSKSITIKVKESLCGEPDIFVPSGFTPDKDNINDYVFVRGRNIEKLYFTIYNRWGEMVFETTDQSKGWDGTYKSMEADPGVFVYYLTANCRNGEEYFKKGNITLIR